MTQYRELGRIVELDKKRTDKSGNDLIALTVICQR